MRNHRFVTGGFTLIELMVGISIAAVLMAVAVPSFQDTSLNSQLRSVANNLAASAHFARSESFKRNSVVTVCVSSDGYSCTAGQWENGWIVKVGAAVLEKYDPAPGGYKITATGGNTTLQFQPTGAGTTTDTFTICRATPSVGKMNRKISIDAAGRVSIVQANTTTCT